MNSPEIGEKKVFLVKNIKHRYRRGINNIYRGHAQTMWTVFWTFLTPLPLPAMIVYQEPNLQ